jgi:solute carrier family 45, member 1/2/4
MGRRRPFIILLSIGVLLGLLLVPNGEDLGYYMGDYYSTDVFNETSSSTSNINQTKILPHRTTAIESDVALGGEMFTSESHSWGIFFTILGTVLLDFDADACQSPSRAYLLDVTQPEDHARGLSTFTIMAGLGGFLGYSLGGINWDATTIGVALGGHVRAVFTLITFIFIFCVAITVTSFQEIPLALLNSFTAINEDDKPTSPPLSYGAVDQNGEQATATVDERKKSLSLNLGKINEGYSSLPGDVAETSFTSNNVQPSPGAIPLREEAVPSLSYYLMSIIHMPKSLLTVCVTNFFCWSAHVCYSLYFTDFVGESVFNGDPKVRKFY